MRWEMVAYWLTAALVSGLLASAMMTAGDMR